jgi:hypothetical protein
MPIVSTVRGSFGPQGRFGAKFGATGGTTTTAGGYKIHTFTLAESGTNLTFSGGVGNVEVLVIAGGGGGGSQNSPGTYGGGGGGAGGLVTISALPVISTSYPVVVGNGGAVNTSGANSTFSTITAVGGGFGGNNSWQRRFWRRIMLWSK